MIMNSSTFITMLHRCKQFLFVFAISAGAFTTSELKANIGCGVLAPSAEGVMDMSQWVTCPPAWINVTCSQLDPGLNYGSPWVANGCGCGSIIYGPYIVDNRVGCGAGTITLAGADITGRVLSSTKT